MGLSGCSSWRLEQRVPVPTARAGHLRRRHGRLSRTRDRSPAPDARGHRHRAHARRVRAARSNHASTRRSMCPGLQGGQAARAVVLGRRAGAGDRSTARRLRDQLRRRQPDRHREGGHPHAADGGREASSTDDGPVHIAIPTTLSAGEFTAVVGITDEETRVKRAVSDPRLVPRTVYTDPTVTLETPPGCGRRAECARWITRSRRSTRRVTIR